MQKLPLLSGRNVAKVFEHLGWEVARQRGSHIILVKKGHIATLSVPDYHEVDRGTLRSLIARANTIVEEFLSVMK